MTKFFELADRGCISQSERAKSEVIFPNNSSVVSLKDTGKSDGNSIGSSLKEMASAIEGLEGVLRKNFIKLQQGRQ